MSSTKPFVYDVSRWGAFPNNDEAAHSISRASSGIFEYVMILENAGPAKSSCLKARETKLASGIQRDSGIKSVRGKAQMVQGGFGSVAHRAQGYTPVNGYQRTETQSRSMRAVAKAFPTAGHLASEVLLKKSKR